MKKVVKTKAFKYSLKGHRDGVISLHSIDGPSSGKLFSASKEGCIRIWDLIIKKMEKKIIVSRIPSQNALQQQLQNQQQENDNILDEILNKNDDDDNINLNRLQQQQQQDEDEQINLNQALSKINFKDIENKNQDIEQFSCVTFSESSIYAGFDDGLIFAWNLKSGEMIHVYEGHIGKVTSVLFLNSRQLLSASLDFTLRLWDVMLGQNEYIYKLSGPVMQIQVENNIIFAMCGKRTFYEIDIAKQQINKNITFAGTSITCFYYIDNLLIFGTIQNSIEVYDLKIAQQLKLEQENQEAINIQPLQIIEGLGGWVLCMKSIDNYLYTGGDDKVIKVWDIKKNFRLVEEFQGHEDSIISIEFAGNMLYTGSYDHTIRSWDIKEMKNRIRERIYMTKEDLWSKKFNAFYQKLWGKKKKKKAKKGGSGGGGKKKKKK